MLTTARDSPNPYDFALVTMLGLLGLRTFDATGANITDLRGQPRSQKCSACTARATGWFSRHCQPAVARAIDRAATDRSSGPILLSRTGNRMDRHAATRRLHGLRDVTSCSRYITLAAAEEAFGAEPAELWAQLTNASCRRAGALLQVYKQDIGGRVPDILSAVLLGARSTGRACLKR